MDVKTMTDIITAIEGYVEVSEGLGFVLGTNCTDPIPDSPFYKFMALYDILERFTTFDMSNDEETQKHYDVLYDKKLSADKKAKLILGLQ